jgi:hypothetical protein
MGKNRIGMDICKQKWEQGKISLPKNFTGDITEEMHKKAFASAKKEYELVNEYPYSEEALLSAVTWYRLYVNHMLSSSQPVREYIEDKKPEYKLNADYLNNLQVDSLNEFLNLVKHGAKSIDIHVRKDAKEYSFQADFLKYLKSPTDNHIEGQS